MTALIVLLAIFHSLLYTYTTMSCCETYFTTAATALDVQATRGWLQTPRKSTPYTSQALEIMHRNACITARTRTHISSHWESVTSSFAFAGPIYVCGAEPGDVLQVHKYTAQRCQNQRHVLHCICKATCMP